MEVDFRKEVDVGAMPPAAPKEDPPTAPKEEPPKEDAPKEEPMLCVEKALESSESEGGNDESVFYG